VKEGELEAVGEEGDECGVDKLHAVKKLKGIEGEVSDAFSELGFDGGHDVGGAVWVAEVAPQIFEEVDGLEWGVFVGDRARGGRGVREEFGLGHVDETPRDDLVEV
jgi:hypothetical protein